MDEGRAFFCRIGTLAVLLLLGLPAAVLADDAVKTAPGAAGGERVDAELLRDLDVLGSADYVRDRELARRLPFLERLRLLERLRMLEGQPAQANSAQPAAPAPREVR